MADNRMWLVNERSGQRVLLATRMTWEWSVPPVNADCLVEKLNAAFEAEAKVSLGHRGLTDWRLEFERDDSPGDNDYPDGDQSEDGE